MKNMKKLASLFLAGTMIFTLAGCGGNGATTMTYKENGTVVECIMEAEGDVVTKITQINTIDTSDYDDATKEAVESAIQSASEAYAGIEGATYETKQTSDELIETVTIDASNPETVKALDESGLFPVDGEGTTISLKGTIEVLESQGFTQDK